MSEPTNEEQEKTKKFFAAARAIVRFLRVIEMNPQETTACLSTAIAIAIRQSGSQWGPEQMAGIEKSITMEVTDPVSDR